MQKLLFVFCLAVFAMACNNEKKEAETKETTEAKPTVAFSMPIAYSSSWEMGNPAYAAMIVKGSWKDWQDNKMGDMKSWVADTILAFLSDNVMVKGADSLAARWNRGRAAYTNVIDTVHAAISLVSTDKKENWVTVWAKEINTTADGKKDTTEVMETWRINKDGKADFLLQYDRHARKK
ncbi:MAG: hypothetical protein HYR66_05170 [Sphingobacteriales bacterium]|nr:hypothetical protein [Sphingobacteriales bacterium]MBI3719834.1 hypothetical protein [Sphingobacteriales bacterium]